MTISATASAAPVADSSDVEFLKSLKWQPGTDAELRRAAAQGDVASFLKLWCRQASASPRLPDEWLASWGHVEGADDALTSLFASRLPTGRRSSKTAIHASPGWGVRVEAFLKRLRSSDAPADAIVPLVGAELCARLARAGDTETLWPVWRAVLEAARSHQPARNAIPSTRFDLKLVEQGELPYVLGTVFAPLAESAAWSRAGKKFLIGELVGRTDSDGTPHAELLPVLPGWIASLARATGWSRWAGMPLWTGDAEGMLESLWERAIPLCQHDGRLSLSNGHPVSPLPVLRWGATTLELASGATSALLANLSRPQTRRPAGRSRSSSGGGLMPSSQSDWARLAVLRSDWSPQADSVVVSHHQSAPGLEVAIGGFPILQGPWQLELQAGSTVLELADEWSCVCWQSDADLDYAELQMVGPKNCRVERQVLLSRTEQFLILADTIRNAPGEPLCVKSTLPLAPGVTFQPEKSSREGWLQADRRRARLLPLAYPIDRVLSTPHKLTSLPGGLEFEYRVAGRGLFAPIIIDWNPNRSRAAVEWRALTVTENSKIVPAGHAAGYRARLGKLQLLLYRSLKTPQFPRAVLGHHTNSETVIATFGKDGTAEPLLTVDDDE